MTIWGTISADNMDSSELRVDPFTPEAGAVILPILEKYQGGDDFLPRYLTMRLEVLFAAPNGRPEWIQEPEWPIQDGKPLTFVGQTKLAIPLNATLVFYVFYNLRSGEPKLVIQNDS